MLRLESPQPPCLPLVCVEGDTENKGSSNLHLWDVRAGMMSASTFLHFTDAVVEAQRGILHLSVMHGFGQTFPRIQFPTMIVPCVDGIAMLEVLLVPANILSSYSRRKAGNDDCVFPRVQWCVKGHWCQWALC